MSRARAAVVVRCEALQVWKEDVTQDVLNFELTDFRMV